MRRSERAVVDPADLAAIIDRCLVPRVAIPTGGAPYVVPVNFGFVRDADRFVFYFHSAGTGRKVELWRNAATRKVGFELDSVLEIERSGDSPCRCTCRYESVVGEGIVSLLEGGEKKTGLDAIVRRFGFDGALEYEKNVFNSTNVYKIDVLSISGKRNER